MRRWIVIGILALGICSLEAQASKTLLEIARAKGEGASVIQGIGLVVGLSGTGDSSDELVMARPLVETLKKYGNPVAVNELSKSKSIALVMVTCQIPRAGGKTDDTYDITIATLNSAKSLKGGTLLVSPLVTAVNPGSQSLVYAFAHGIVEIPDEDIPTMAIVKGGAQLVRDINTTPSITGAFDLIVDSNYAGYAAVSSIASEINQQYLLTSNPLNQAIATPIDSRTIRVIVPITERSQPASFYGDIMQTDISSALRRLPAQVRCDTRNKLIVVTGNVMVSHAIISLPDMSITTTAPPPDQPTDPQGNPTTLGSATPQDARLEDLIMAFDQLDIPTNEQIDILKMLKETGKLHAKLIIDGKE